MSDNLNPEASGEPKGDAAPAAGAGTEPIDSTPDVNALAARLRRNEKMLQQVQAENQAYKQAEAAKADAERSELDKAKARNTELEAKLAEVQTKQVDTMKRTAFRHAVERLGVANADDALRLADLSSLEVDGDKVLGVDALAKAFKREKTYLFTSLPAVAGSGGGNPAGGPPGTVTANDIKKMTPAEFAEYRKSRR